MEKINIIGAGLAGAELALTLSKHGIKTTIFEQKPLFKSDAHQSSLFAELVCSNSLRSAEIATGIGLLKEEMQKLGSFFMQAAYKTQIPAGKALAVDREKFSEYLTSRLQTNPLIKIKCARIDSLDDPALENGITVICAGPMVSEKLAADLAKTAGQENCFFYDAIAPIIWTDSLNKEKLFRASRYNASENSEGDYLNCPLSREEYDIFYDALISSQVHTGHMDETVVHFEGCMPIEALAQRGRQTLLFGPFKPVGLIDPKTGKRPYAVLQLRAENANMQAANLVGCQTKLLQKEQEKVFKLIPALKTADFVRYGSMHRNTFLNAPKALNDDLSLKNRPNCHVCGQLSGVEGYVESAASALWLGLYLAKKLNGKDLPPLPVETALGALLNHLRAPAKKFQPSNINFGLMPALNIKAAKKNRKTLYAERAAAAFNNWQKQL